MIPIPLTIVFMLADRLPAHVLWMGWGGVGYNVRCNCFVTDLLRHFYLRCNCFVTVLLRHFYLRCNCFVTVLLRHFYLLRDFVTTWGWGWGWGTNVRCNCFVTDLLRHCYLRCNCFVTELLRHCYLRCNCFVTVLLRHIYLRCNCFVTVLLRHFYTYVAIASSRSCYATWGNNLRRKVMISWKPTLVICSKASLYFAVLWNLRTRQ